VLDQLERGAVADLQLELAGLLVERMDLQVRVRVRVGVRVRVRIGVRV